MFTLHRIVVHNAIVVVAAPFPAKTAASCSSQHLHPRPHRVHSVPLSTTCPPAKRTCRDNQQWNPRNNEPSRKKNFHRFHADSPVLHRIRSQVVLSFGWRPPPTCSGMGKSNQKLVPTARFPASASATRFVLPNGYRDFQI